VEGGGGVMKCSGEAVLFADLVTQLPELVNLANERGGGLRNITLTLVKDSPVAQGEVAHRDTETLEDRALPLS